jgi:hypothetical protein
MYMRVHICYLLVVCIISGCSWTKQFLYMDGNSGKADTLPVAVEELLEMAYYCDEAYSKATPENKLYEISGASDNKDEFSYHVKQDGGITILIFRGSNNRQNMLSDIDFRPFEDEELEVNLHRGFRDAAMFLEKDIKANYPLEKTVYLTGHSLGGAIAQIVGFWLDREGYNVQIYTFGSPKVTTTFLGNKPPHYRVVVNSDPIPFMPIYPYVHSGIRIDAKTLNWSENDDYGKFTEIDAQDHSITYYLRTLSEHAFPKLCDECE